MQINRNDLVFRTAYYWHEEKNKPTEQINICKLFWLFAGSVCMHAGGVLFWLMFIVPLSLLSIPLFGYRLASLWEARHCSAEVIPLKRWPKRKNGKQFMPVIYPLIAVFVVAYVLFFYYIGHGTLWLTSFLWELSPALFLTSLLLAALAIIVATPKFRRSEVWQLLKAFAKAKKERICPFVKIIS